MTSPRSCPPRGGTLHRRQLPGIDLARFPFWALSGIREARHPRHWAITRPGGDSPLWWGFLEARSRQRLRLELGSGAGERREPAEGAQVSPYRAAVLGPREQGLVRRAGCGAAWAGASVPPGRRERPPAEVAANTGARRGRPGGHCCGRRPGSDFQTASQYARQYARTMGRRGTMHPSLPPENPGKCLVLLLVPHWSRIHISR